MAAGTGFAACQAPGAATAAQWPLQTFLELGALATAPGCARGHVRSVLHEWGLADRVDTAQLLVSELVTNAVCASEALRVPGVPVCRLRMVSDRHSVVLSVWDGSDAMPVGQEAGPDQQSGRGLMLVAALGQDWGAYPAQPGKVVWVAL
jgi:anti-sigma regulatory factor (Ser/Thr protein kinase)